MDKTISETNTKVQVLAKRMSKTNAARASVYKEAVKEMLNSVLGSQGKR